jgi:hypothetical protein
METKMRTTTVEQDYWTTREMAVKLGLTHVRVWQLAAKEHRLPYVWYGKQLRFPKAAWEAYQKAQVRQALTNCGMGGDDAA